MLALKVFTSNLHGAYQTSFAYPPVGEWTPSRPAALCSSGYHVANKLTDLQWYIRNDRFKIFVVECRDDRKAGADKSVFSQIRLIQEVKIDNETIVKCYNLLKTRYESWFNKKEKLRRIFNLIWIEKDKKKLDRVAKLLNIPRFLLKRDLQKVIHAVAAGKQKA